MLAVFPGFSVISWCFTRFVLGPEREGGPGSADSTLGELPEDPGVAPPTAGLFLLGGGGFRRAGVGVGGGRHAGSQLLSFRGSAG